MMSNHAVHFFQPPIIEKRKATQPIKIKAKTHANEYGRYNNSVLNNS